MPAAEAPGSRKLAHTPALDGLRAIAIAAVMLFHFPTRTVVIGGLFGVDMFFALSGFLVTALLLAELQGGPACLKEFLGRRGWRLLPALACFLMVYLAADAAFGRTTWFASNPFGSPRGHPIPFGLALKGAVAAGTYSLNELRVHHVALPPITHLWSLSIEGQFYVLWPVVVVLLVRRAPRALLPVTLTAAAVAAAVPFVIWHGGSGANAIYFGSVPQMQGLLIGSAGAQLWSSGLTLRVPVDLRRALAGIGAVTLIWMFVAVGNHPFKYLGGITLASVAAVVMVVHFAEPGAPGTWARVLGSRPMAWLGQRSYAIYLWHYVLDCWTNELPHAIGVPLGMAASLVVAELSWRLVEQPAQRLARRRRVRHRELSRAGPAPTSHPAPALTATAQPHRAPAVAAATQLRPAPAATPGHPHEAPTVVLPHPHTPPRRGRSLGLRRR